MAIPLAPSIIADLNRARQLLSRAGNPANRTRVYLSGPITAGDRNWNQYQANRAHKLLMQNGYAVLNPMPTGVLPFAWDGSIDHAAWLESDFAWLCCADIVIRLPGESKGGDMETKHASALGIPVYLPHHIPCLRDIYPDPDQRATAA